MTKVSLGLPPIAEWTQDGQTLTGRYAGSALIKPKNLPREMKVHYLIFGSGTCHFVKPVSGEKIEVSEGERVSVSGGYFDTAFLGLREGIDVEITYRGTEKKGRNGNNPARIFDVFQLIG